nr:odorant-binding protein 13 [Lytta caraganae]
MKSIIFFTTTLCLLSTIQAKGLSFMQTQKLALITQHCLAATDVPIENLLKFGDHQYDDNDDEVKEYVHCWCKAAGIIDDDGEFRTNRIRKTLNDLLDKETANKILSECLIKAESPVETAWKYSKCVHQYLPAHYPQY